MKILHGPDLHCFYDNYGKVSSDGIHSRLIDWQKSTRAMVDIAKKEKVDLAIFPGDFFKNSVPDATQIIAVADLFDAFEQAGIKVVGCPGNHDLVAFGKRGPNELVSRITEKHTSIMNPEIFCIEDLDICVLPSVKPSGLIEVSKDPVEAAILISQKLVDISRGLYAQCTNKKKILIGHWTISGAVASSGQVLYGGVEPAIPLAELMGMGWDAVLFGHIHKKQILSQNPFIAYAGAMERVDFGEEDDERGCFIVDLDNNRHEWFNLPARRFKTVELTEEIINSIATTGNYNLIDWTGTEDAIVRVKYQISIDQMHMIDNGLIIKSAYDTGKAFQVSSVIPEIETSERRRDTTVTENTSPSEALGKWLNGKSNISEVIRNNALLKGTLLLKEVMSDGTY